MILIAETFKCIKERINYYKCEPRQRLIEQDMIKFFYPKAASVNRYRRAISREQELLDMPLTEF